MFNEAQVIVQSKLDAQRSKTGRVRAIILKARQLGISTSIAARNYHDVTMNEGLAALVLADKQKRAETLFSIYDLFNQQIPPEIKPKQRFGTKGKHLVFAEPKGGGGLNSQVAVETASDTEAGRSATIQRLHASELAFWEKPAEVWTSLMQAVPDQGSEVIIESTANGVGGLFYDLWQEAESGDSSWIPIFIPWWIQAEYRVPVTSSKIEEMKADLDEYERQYLEGIEFEGEIHVLTFEQLAWRRQTIKDKLNGDTRMFRQEYPGTPREAFLVSGAAFFDEKALQLYEHVTQNPPWRGQIERRKTSIYFAPSDRGYLRVWEKPQPEGRYCIWADTAAGKQVAASREQSEQGGTDFCSADVFNVATHRYVAQLHGRIDPDLFAKMLYDLGFWYSARKSIHHMTERTPALLAVERNHSSGETAIKYLQGTEYPNLYYHRTINRRTNKPTVLCGWVTNVESRQPMLDEFKAALRDEAVSLWNADTIRECWTFVRGEDGKPQAQEGCHDDRVMSAAGALAIARFVVGMSRGLPKPPPVGADATGYGPPIEVGA